MVRHSFPQQNPYESGPRRQQLSIQHQHPETAFFGQNEKRAPPPPPPPPQYKQQQQPVQRQPQRQQQQQQFLQQLQQQQQLQSSRNPPQQPHEQPQAVYYRNDEPVLQHHGKKVDFSKFDSQTVRMKKKPSFVRQMQKSVAPNDDAAAAPIQMRLVGVYNANDPVQREDRPKPKRINTNYRWTMGQLRQTDAMVRSQSGTNRYASQKGMIGFGTIRNTKMRIEGGPGEEDLINSSNAIIPLQYGTNQFASQKGMTGFGSPRDVSGRHLHRIWEGMDVYERA